MNLNTVVWQNTKGCFLHLNGVPFGKREKRRKMVVVMSFLHTAYFLESNFFLQQLRMLSYKIFWFWTSVQCLPRIQDMTHTYPVHSSHIFCCTFPEEVDSKRLRTNKPPALPIIVSHQKLTRELTFRCFFFVLWVRYFTSDCMILPAQLTTPLQPLWMLLIEKTSFSPIVTQKSWRQNTPTVLLEENSFEDKCNKFSFPADMKCMRPGKCSGSGLR